MAMAEMRTYLQKAEGKADVDFDSELTIAFLTVVNQRNFGDPGWARAIQKMWHVLYEEQPI